MTEKMECQIGELLLEYGPHTPKEIAVLLRREEDVDVSGLRQQEVLPENFQQPLAVEVREVLESSTSFAEDDSSRFHLTDEFVGQ